MPFALDSSPELSEISEAVNYLLANFGANISADPNSGQISGPGGIVVAYLYKYLAVKYADSFDGSSGFSDSPTNKLYYGINNSNSDIESTNPADYIWYKVAGGGFGTTKFLFYQVAGGRQIYFTINTAAPDDTYVQVSTGAIDLDVITTSNLYQNANPTIYQWTATSTPPARPTTTTTYYWNTGVYTAPSGWSTTIPINTNENYYLWAITIQLTVSSTVTTSILDWTNTTYSIYVLSRNGSTGINSASVFLYNKNTSTTPPALFSGTFTYTFATGVLSGGTFNGWSQTPPSIAAGEYLFVSVATASSTNATDSIPYTEFSAPQVMSGTGVDGAKTAIVTIYNKNTSAVTPPTSPSGTFTYTFATAALSGGTLNGWSQSAPTLAIGEYLWEKQATAYANATTDSIAATEFSGAVVVGAYGPTGPAGTSGVDGLNGLSALTAYKVQSQSASTPTFTTPTSGATAPSGWSLTAPSVAVGQVLWYIQGQYNSSSSYISGIAPNTTAWTGPVAASVFQDIRSDNWNGSNPPVYGTTSTYGSTGYYIQRSTGDVYFNDGVFRGDISTDGDAYFAGLNSTTTSISIDGTSYPLDYSSYSYATSQPRVFNSARVAVLGYASAPPYTGAGFVGWNAGVVGVGKDFFGSSGIGLVGQGDHFGAYISGSIAGLVCSSTIGSATNVAFQINSTGRFVWNNYYIDAPTGDTTKFLRNDGTWAVPAGSGTGTVTSVSGTGSVSGITLSGTVTTSGSLTLGGSLSLTTGNLTATAPGSNYYLSGSGWTTTNNVMTSAGTNSGTATASSNTINFLGSTSTGIAGAYVGTSGSGSTVTFTVQTTSPSDVRLKEEIQDIELGLNFVEQLRPVSYKLKADPKHQKGYGFIADEVEQLGVYGSSLVYDEPDWKVGDEVGFKTIHYPSYVAVLTKAIQELSDKVKALESQLGK